MADKIPLMDAARTLLDKVIGNEIDVTFFRKELEIQPESPAWTGIHTIISRLVDEKRLKQAAKKGYGSYKVVEPVHPVQVFGEQRENRPPFDLMFPTDRETEMELDFAKEIVIREGDLIMVSGVKNKCKTVMCLNFCGENINKLPVLMGNEYTNLVSEKVIIDGKEALKPKHEPNQRFVNRLKAMEWLTLTDEKGYDKFTLLPVMDDYAYHIIKDRINIIDWINPAADRAYDIGAITRDIKANLGRGVAIVAVQKQEGASNPRGGQFALDYVDCMLLLDSFGRDEFLLTIGTVKEAKSSVSGRSYAFFASKGIEIHNFREMKKCPDCRGSGFKAGKECETCLAKKYVDKG